MEKMSFTDKNVAFDYAIYMIVGSCFDKTSCSNSLLEKKMRLQYLEQKPDAQYRMEDICISFAENVLAEALPKEFWKREAKVSFRKNPGDDSSTVQFACGEYVLAVGRTGKGRRPAVQYKLYRDRQAEDLR